MKRGFTLIELLAVIVIMAILALIAVPIISAVIDKSRKLAAQNSVFGFVDAIEKRIAVSALKNESFEDGEYTFDDIAVNIKGQGITNGKYELVKGKVTNAVFCVNGYIVIYNGETSKVGDRCNTEELKYASTITVSKTTSFLNYPETDTIKISENTSGGALSCTSSDPSVATCEINENNLIIKSGEKKGTATITVTSEETSKFTETHIALVVSTEDPLVSVTANGYTGVYDGIAHGITVSSSGADIKYGVTEGTYDLNQSPTYTDAGTYQIFYEVSKEGHKTVRGSRTVIINKAPGIIKLEQYSGSIAYNEEREISITESVGEISSSIEDPTVASATITNGKLVVRGLKVGTTTITLTSVGTNNYNEATTTFDVIVEKASNTLTLSGNTGSVTYPGSISFNVTQNKSGGALSCVSSNTSAVTCSISNTTITLQSGTTASNSITITVTSEATENYKSSSATYLVTNNLGVLSVTANGYTGTYDGYYHGITVISSGATIRYGTSAGTYNLTTSPTYINAGTYTVYYQVTKTGYNTVTGSRTVTIYSSSSSGGSSSGGSSSYVSASSITYTNNGQSTVQTALNDLFNKIK